MVLTGAQHKALHDALIQEFYKLELLEHWVRWALNWNLAEYARTDTLSNAVFDLINRADALGILPDLVLAAIRAAPQNAALRTVAAGMDLVVDVPPDALSSMPTLRPATYLSPQEQQNRQRMIARVRDAWIKGVLEQSVYAATRIELGLQEAPDAVANPWRFALEQPERPAQALPPGTPISQVYDQTDGSLLILGAPGAGKTTLLLELARTCLDRAERDLTQPIPVVFHLSTWAATRRPLAAWLVAELREKYQVQAKVGQPWVDGDHLLILLDGLDEVALAHRPACVAAINAYRQEHGLTPLVVCSREADYRALSTPLTLSHAVVVQPLTPEQIAAYFEQGGAALAGVRAALDSDPELRALLDTPLMLNVLALTYHDVPNLQGADLPTTRQQIFAAYVQRMLTRRSTTARYSLQRTQHWLAWLARQMSTRNETVFYIERLQPEWLPRAERVAYRWLTILAGVLGGGLAGGLVGGHAGSLLGGLSDGLTFAIIAGLVGGVVGGVILRSGIWLHGAMLDGQPPPMEITPTETLLWSWEHVRQALGKTFPLWRGIALFGGVVGGLAGGLAGWRAGGVVSGLLGGLVGGLAGGLGGGLEAILFIGLFGGFSADLLDDRNRSDPNQGMWQSARNGLLVGLSSGLLIGLVFGLGNALLGGPLIGLDTGLGTAMLGALLGGWASCTTHLILRFVLWRVGVAPLNMVRFLDYAHERILLRKVGGGYIFIHRMLLEYFAGLEPSAPVDPKE